MREVVREKLAEGQRDEEIKGFFVQRYGPSVLMAPPLQGFHLVAWVVPPAAVLLALGGLLLVLRRLQGDRRVAGTSASPEGGQQEYLRRAEAVLEEEVGRGLRTPGEKGEHIPGGPGGS